MGEDHGTRTGDTTSKCGQVSHDDGIGAGMPYMSVIINRMVDDTSSEEGNAH